MGSLEELKTYFADESYSHHTAQAVIEFIEDKLTISNMEKEIMVDGVVYVPKVERKEI
jgi:hypothetical protein